MKRLFMLRTGNKPVKVNKEVEYFSRKEHAKELRDSINKERNNGATHVALGPDHMGYHGISSKYRANKIR